MYTTLMANLLAEMDTFCRAYREIQKIAEAPRESLNDLDSKILSAEYELATAKNVDERKKLYKSIINITNERSSVEKLIEIMGFIGIANDPSIEKIVTNLETFKIYSNEVKPEGNNKRTPAAENSEIGEFTKFLNGAAKTKET